MEQIAITRINRAFGIEGGEDPRELDYRNGLLSQQQTVSQGEVQRVDYLDTNGDIAVREVWSWRRNFTNKIYAGYDITLHYFDLNGEVVQGYDQTRSFDFEQGRDIQATQDRFQRNLYQLGSYIMNSLQDIGFLSLFPMAHTQKALYIDATIVPLITFINELSGPEYDPIMNAPLPNGKTVRQHSLEECLVDMAIDYESALAYLNQ